MHTSRRRRGRPGRLALQYWLYYVFNDYIDKHESDWELIQLHFDADTVEEALQRPPVEVLYSQHEGAERAGWNDDKLEKVGGTHVVTYPGAGSRANYYRNALWLGRSADEGLGCDDSTGPSTRVRPRAVVLPTRPEATSEHGWITFEGHWGQRERGFNDGPLGPNVKLQWVQPFTWAESVERNRSFTVPGSAHEGLDSSDVFCSGITAASELLDGIYASKWVGFAVIGLLVALLVLALVLTRWRPAQLRPLEQRRAAGQILRVSFRVYRIDWRTLYMVSALVFPLAFLAALAAHALLNLGPGQDLVQAPGRETLLTVHLYVLVLAAIEVAVPGWKAPLVEECGFAPYSGASGPHRDHTGTMVYGYSTVSHLRVRRRHAERPRHWHQPCRGGDRRTRHRPRGRQRKQVRRWERKDRRPHPHRCCVASLAEARNGGSPTR